MYAVALVNRFPKVLEYDEYPDNPNGPRSLAMLKEKYGLSDASDVSTDGIKLLCAGPSQAEAFRVQLLNALPVIVGASAPAKKAKSKK